MSDKALELKKDDQGISNDNAFNGLSILLLLYRYKLFIAIVVIIATATSVYFSLQMDNWYAATVNVVPPKSTGSLMQGALGNISSALKDFGLTKLGGKGGSGTYSLMVLLDSRTVKDSMIAKYNLAEAYDIPDSHMTDLRKEFSGNLDVTLESEGNYLITIWDKDPEKAVRMVNDFLYYTNNLAKKVSRREATMNREYMEQRLTQTEANILKITDTLQRFSKKHMIFAPEEQAAAITKAISELKAEMVKSEVTYQMLVNTYGENDLYTKMQKDVMTDMKKKINDIQNRPGFAGNFALKNSFEVGAEFLRMYAELETNTKVKAFLIPMLEEAKLEEVKETYSLFPVDPAVPPDKKSKPKRSLYVAGTFFGSLLICILFIIFLNAFRNFKEKFRIYKANNYKLS